ncbi:Decapping nuclease [Pleurotus pulmonarius]
MQHDQTDLLLGLASYCSGAIKRRKVDVVEEGDIQISDCKYLASYNWLRDQRSTIVVPGSPNVLQDIDSIVPGSVQLQAEGDGGNQASARHAMFSPHILPLFAAVNLALVRRPAPHPPEPPFDWTAFHFITDRSLLRQLHRWACAEKGLAFRIDVQLLGAETVVMGRYKMDTVRYPRSFGSSFEDMFTRPAEGCENTATHHRIISYDMEGLKMVVRFEVDAYMQDPDAPAPPTPAPNTDQPATPLEPDALRLSGYDLEIRCGGSWDVPQSALVELKTTKASTRPIWKRDYPQLFLSQTPHSYRAFHDAGAIMEVQHDTLDSLAVRGVHARNAEGLQKLRKALEMIRREVVRLGKRGRQMSLVCQGGDLRLHYRATGALVPEGILDLAVANNLFEKI